MTFVDSDLLLLAFFIVLGLWFAFVVTRIIVWARTIFIAMLTCRFAELLLLMSLRQALCLAAGAYGVLAKKSAPRWYPSTDSAASIHTEDIQKLGMMPSSTLKSMEAGCCPLNRLLLSE